MTNKKGPHRPFCHCSLFHPRPYLGVCVWAREDNQMIEGIETVSCFPPPPPPSMIFSSSFSLSLSLSLSLSPSCKKLGYVFISFGGEVSFMGILASTLCLIMPIFITIFVKIEMLSGRLNCTLSRKKMNTIWAHVSLLSCSVLSLKLFLSSRSRKCFSDPNIETYSLLDNYYDL